MRLIRVPEHSSRCPTSSQVNPACSRKRRSSIDKRLRRTVGLGVDMLPPISPDSGIGGGWQRLRIIQIGILFYARVVKHHGEWCRIMEGRTLRPNTGLTRSDA